MNNIENKTPINKKRYLPSKILCSVFVIASVFLFLAAMWYVNTYGDTGFDSIVFTLLSNMGGVETDIVLSFILRVVVPTVIIGIIFVTVLILILRKPKKIKYILSMSIPTVIAIALILTAGAKVDLFHYIYGITHQSTIFTTKYIDPSLVEIKFPEKKRNLIYIFLESMETTYMSKDVGGAMDKNIIPELTDLAKNNINFSHNDGIGGFLTPTGTTWTASAMVAHTSGIPLKEAAGMFERNQYGSETFLPGAISISNILDENGYNQALMVGSFASFGHRDVYYKNHAVENVYDLNNARKDGIVPEDYYVWWGMEDKHLFRYAKEKILEISEKDEPFAFSLLTVDTHFTAGFPCDLCDSDSPEQYNNVLECSSRQVNEFINWIKSQDFYDNTTIVVVGDHLTMDNGYIQRNVDEGYKRHVYNCFINSAITSDNYKNRVFTGMDLFPTTLAAMGCEISGERLGLGTNLFSNVPTLAEEMGFEALDYQLSLNSTEYIKKFVTN